MSGLHIAGLALQTSEDVVLSTVGKTAECVDSVEVAGFQVGTVTTLPACSENPTTATTPAETPLKSLINLAVIVNVVPVTVLNDEMAPLRQNRRGESVLEPS